MASDFFNSPFDNDPFFGMHRERLRNADEVFSSFFNSDPFLALTDGSRPQQRRQEVDRPRSRARGSPTNQMMPFDPFESMNQMMNNMRMTMGNMSQNMSQMTNGPDGHVYSQSSVMSYSNAGNGPPKIYQATTATKQMPGGLRETRKAIHDSEAGLEKMAIGRKINDRGNIISRQRDIHMGNMEENRDYINMAEEDAAQFDHEWQEKTEPFYRNSAAAGIGHPRNQRAVGEASRTRPALEAPSNHKSTKKQHRKGSNHHM